MSQNWRTVRVFISSTFRDMQAERDHLVRVVFPELKERCRKRHVQLVDVDLRWGVTQEEAEGGGALDICLDEIDSCRPYFLGLLGQRYGYIPPGHPHSITAEEIYHGVLRNDPPHQLLDLRPFVEGILEGRTLAKDQVDCLVRCYLWNPEKRKYLLKEEVSPEDEKTLRSIFDVYSIYQKDRSFFFFRSEILTRELAGAKIDDYFEADAGVRVKLAKLKQEIIDAGLPYFEYEDIETFGQKVLETLWRHIDAEFPEKREEIERDWLKEEAELHELFISDRTRRFVGRSDILKRMHTFTEEDSGPRLMVITGEPGCGKSALMARFTEEVVQHHPDWLVLAHFVGASPSSTSLRLTLKRLCTQLNRALGVAEEVPEEYKELAQLLPELLQRASGKYRILLVIDALNQFEKTDNAYTMRWLPQKLPQNAMVVVSTLAGEILDALKARRIQSRFEELGGLTELETELFVNSYLKEIRKEFPTPEIRDAFYDKVKAGNPLYILVALEELRVFPLYEEMGKRVASLPDTVPELFNQVLERVEGDFNQPLVRDLMSFIACGRHGMTSEELQTLLRGYALAIDPDKPPAKLPDMVFSRLRRAFSAYLLERSGVIDFFHGQLKEAVGKRYLSEEAERDKTHQIIADYFGKRWFEPYLRALDELPHQLNKAKDWDGLERILCDLHFIETKCAAGMTYELVRDYNSALDALPEAQPERQKEQEHEARLKKYAEDLIAYAKGETDHLEIIPSVKPWSEKKIREDAERIINNPLRLDRMRAFSQFVNSESYALVKFGYIGFCLQQAYNSANSGPVASTAESIINAGADDILLLRHPSWRFAYNHHPALLSTLLGHAENWVDSVSITSDGKRAVSGGNDETPRVWDLKSGECLRTLEGHTDVARSVDITPDGRRAVSGSSDKTLRVWDLESGECLRTLEGHTGEVTGVRITPDGKKAVSKSLDKTLRVWDLESGECLRTFEKYAGWIYGISVTPDGRRAVSGSVNNTLKVWDLKSGECLRTLEGHTREVISVSVTPDGKTAVYGGYGNLEVWNLESGECLRTLEGHKLWVNSVCITPDGKIAVSGGNDKTIRVWDLESGECLRTFEGHTNTVSSVSITPDGRRAVSVGTDTTLRVWDLESGECLRAVEWHTNVVSSVEVAPDWRRAVSGSWDKTLRVWDLESGECLRTLEGHTGEVTGVRITPDGKKAVSKSLDKTLRVWDLKSGEYLRTLEEPTSEVNRVSITPDGRRAVSQGGESLRVWDLESGKCLRTLKGHEDYVQSVCITPDGKRAVSGSRDNTLRVWDLESGKCLRTLKGHRHWVESVCITSDGRVAISRSEETQNMTTLRVWDLESGKCLRTFEGHTEWIPSWLLEEVESMGITPDGRRVITICRDITLKIWAPRSGECLRTLEGHTLPITNVSITPGGRGAVSVSYDGTLRVWDLESGECLAICHSKSLINSISGVSASGEIVLGTRLGEVNVFTPINLPIRPPIVTPVRIRQHDKSRWDDNITTVCLSCGQRFPVADGILAVIRSITNIARLSSGQSPCLELPDEAWDDPRLVSECPVCHKPLKFNPFIVDNRGRY